MRLQVSQPELMRPVIKLTLPTLSLFFAEKNLKALGTSSTELANSSEIKLRVAHPYVIFHLAAFFLKITSVVEPGP